MLFGIVTASRASVDGEPDELLVHASNNFIFGKLRDPLRCVPLQTTLTFERDTMMGCQAQYVFTGVIVYVG